MPPFRKVVVLGLDGLDPRRARSLIRSGQLPHLAALQQGGGFTDLATTMPAQTPVAWSTFATGVNPGGHGIFDFISRVPATYGPSLALARHEQRSVLLPPAAVNLRSGTPFWSYLSAAGVASTVLRCPCTYPAERLRGRLLSGMGVPDLRGGIGTATVLTADPAEVPREGEVLVQLLGAYPRFQAPIPGPQPDQRSGPLIAPIEVNVQEARDAVIVRCGDHQVSAALGEWSPWLPLRFRRGALSSAAGQVRCLTLSLDPLTVYLSPVNFDPRAPAFSISHPWEYARELERTMGRFYTAGFVEDHTALTTGRIDEGTFLRQCDDAMRERTAMLRYELNRFSEGLLFCLYDTPDRLQHMFWRYEESDHPAHGGADPRTSPYRHAIDDHYRACDAVVGEVIRAVDDQTLFLVLSDHGFCSFRRGIHLNSWLLRHGWLALKPGASAGEGPGLSIIDWSRTRAYALGVGALYLNVRGREGEGIVAPAERQATATQLAAELDGLMDVDRGQRAIRRVFTRDTLYHGPRLDEAPDVLVGFERGYRASWDTVLGGVPSGIFEDNTRKWSGDHIVDPDLVPAALFMNRPFVHGGAMVDIAPTVLSALGVPVPGTLEGKSLLPSDR